MKSMMVKTTLREIKQSLGRYLAILAIVALGVGFFSGLKVTMDSMVVSADNYLSEAQFFDYRLLSTLGFEEEDVEALAAKEGVRAVEGALSVDVIFINAQGNESVIKAHSLSEMINKVVLTAGRLPESGDECVVDGNLYGESAIGSKVILAESNSEEDIDNFTYREYTITGIVQASYYIQFERGNTSLGNGRVSGFMYLLPEGFQMDYYTEIFVKFDTDYPIYSEEYESFIEEKKAVWESYCEVQGQRRYDAVLKEADEELADPEADLADKKEEAETE
ncbi:MAG: ABC transporter permease, partial [Lachnospiraceae bacterium]|nr:ABC transporter permease [Lachnospiraceae bacterium]